MNDEDAKKFYAAADTYPDIRYKTAAMILLLTGMRRGELCGLEWSNIDFKEATITIERSVTTVAGIFSACSCSSARAAFLSASVLIMRF